MYRSRILDAVRSNYCLTLILVVALAVRLVLAFAVQSKVDMPPARLCLISGDAEGYWELAQNLVAGKDYAIYQPARYVLRVPGFPMVLAVSQWFFGNRAIAARCLLALIGTVACGLTYWLGREIADTEAGLLAAAYTALSPTQALFSVLILSETTFALSLLASLIAMVRSVRSFSAPVSLVRTFSGGLWSGIWIGVATLVRPTWLYVGFLIAVATLLVCPNKTGMTVRHRGIVFAGLLAGIVATMTPWTVRNFVVTHHFVPTTLWAGPSLYDGLHSGATGDSEMTFIETDNLRSRMSEYQMDREYSRRAWEFIVAHPYKTMQLAVVKQLRYWSLFPNAAQFQNQWMQWFVCLTVLPLFVFSLIGFWQARRDLLLIVVAFGPVVLFAGLHLLFVGSLRYRLPAEFPLAIAAAIGIRSFSRLLVQKSPS